MKHNSNKNEVTYRRMVNAVRDKERPFVLDEELFFCPDSGKLVLASDDAPTLRQGAVAASTLAREGFFGAYLA